MGRRRRKKKNPDIVPASSDMGKEKIAEIIQEMKDKGELPEFHIEEDRHEATMVRVTPICWAIPFDEVVFSKWVKHFISTVRPMPWDDTIVSHSTYLPDARNLLHTRFVEESKCEFLFMLDSDVIPPPNTVHVLLKHMQQNPEIRIVGGWYRKKDHPYLPVVYHFDGVDEDGIAQYQNYGLNEIKSGLEEVEGAGAGCWMVHRSVAEAVGKEPYSMSEGGEDLYFCRRVQEAGYKLWIDWDLACAHAGVAVA